MEYKVVRFILVFNFLFAFGHCFAQQTVVKGRVKEAVTGTPIPFANVIFKGSTIGTTTDFLTDCLRTIQRQWRAV